MLDKKNPKAAKAAGAESGKPAPKKWNTDKQHDAKKQEGKAKAAVVKSSSAKSVGGKTDAAKKSSGKPNGASKEGKDVKDGKKLSGKDGKFKFKPKPKVKRPMTPEERKMAKPHYKLVSAWAFHRFRLLFHFMCTPRFGSRSCALGGGPEGELE